MLEIELKYPVADFIEVEKILMAWEVSPKKIQTESDAYFNAPDRDFAQTDEALRIRSIGFENFVTYKGPKRDSQSKTRKEIEVPLGGGSEVAESFGELLQELGYKPVAAVQKRRKIYHLERDDFPVQLCMDEVEQVGNFIEIEIVAPEEEMERGRAVLWKLAEELRLKDTERRSYLELLLRRK